MDSNDEMIEITQCCSRCGLQFQARAISWNGKPLFGSQICPPCCAVENQEKQKAEMESCTRSLCHSWLEICPVAYAETDQTRLPQEALSKVLHWQRGSRGLLLVGESRKGKTRCVWMLLKKLHWQQIRFEAMSETEFSIRCSKHNRDRTLHEFLERLTRVPVLFLDDIGHSATTSKNLEELYHIIETRTSHKRPIIATTQFSGSELAEKSADRHQKTILAIVNRLREFCEIIPFYTTKHPFNLVIKQSESLSDSHHHNIIHP